MTRAKYSLTLRLLLASTLLLPLCLGAAAWALERSHERALTVATAQRLQLQVLALLAQADVNPAFEMPQQQLETRLNQPSSGLYAIVTDSSGQILWLSPSAARLTDPQTLLSAQLPLLQPGESHTSEYRGLLRQTYQVVWELNSGDELALRFTVAESTAGRAQDIAVFRAQLLLWLGTTALVMLGAQLVIVRWGLKPLRRLTQTIAKIEAGEEHRLEGVWPSEVEPLADNLQNLLAGEQSRRQRMRNTLADLAHSLKTPLAVLRSADRDTDDYAQVCDEQLSRMEEVIAWQLQRATQGQSRLLQRTPVAPAFKRLQQTLHKVYGDRGIDISIDCPEDAKFRGDERDLLEILGNVLDNACKYGKSLVNVQVTGGGDIPLSIVIEDNGDGISPDLRDGLLERGSRADSRREGQGLGLAIVLELVNVYSGSLAIDTSRLGGARVELSLP